MTTSISRKNTAKMIRKIIKANFKGTKFSVRMNGGNSINVRWVDGPSECQVKAKIGHCRGASFDGMVDLKSYHDTTITNSAGEQTQVHFGNDYLFTDRNYTPEFLTKIAKEQEKEYGLKAPAVLTSDYDGYGYIQDDGESLPGSRGDYYWTMRLMIMRAAQETAA